MDILYLGVGDISEDLRQEGVVMLPDEFKQTVEDMTTFYASPSIHALRGRAGILSSIAKQWREDKADRREVFIPEETPHALVEYVKIAILDKGLSYCYAIYDSDTGHFLTLVRP